MVVLTKRMKAWAETGCHLNVADKSGNLFVTVARTVKSVSDDEIIFILSNDEYSVIKSALSESSWVAIGVSGVGGIRACYQFKGKGSVTPEGDKFILSVKLSEVYCTKPGCYAGQRLDIMPSNECEEWDQGL